MYFVFFNSGFRNSLRPDKCEYFLVPNQHKFTYFFFFIPEYISEFYNQIEEIKVFKQQMLFLIDNAGGQSITDEPKKKFISSRT